MQLRPAVIRTTALLFMGLFAPLGIAACAGGGGAQGAHPSAPSHSSQGSRTIAPQAVAVPWSAPRLGGKDQVLLDVAQSVTNPADPCYVHVTSAVVYTGTTITITLKPTRPVPVCTTQAVPASPVAVKLQEPVGHKILVDGATGLAHALS